MVTKIGITLSGGAVKGIAHVGILRALRENHIRPNVIIGTSAGAIAAAMVASGVEDEDIIHMARTSRLTRLLRFNWPKLGLLPMDRLSKRMKEYINHELLEDLPTKVWINVTDLETGRSRFVDKGPIMQYVMASSAIPMMFEPQQVEGRYYIDGGVTNNMPAKFLKPSCDFIIGSNVVNVSERAYGDIKGFLPVLDRALDISLYERTKTNYKYCDFVFEPPGMHRYEKFAFDQAEQIYQEGYEYAQQVMPELLDKIEGYERSSAAHALQN